MVWGAFCADGMVDLPFPTPRTNSSEYIRVLENRSVPSLEGYAEQDFIFQKDNASVHVSRQTKQWFLDNNIKVLEWPACSPDQNTIENVWGLITRHVYTENKPYSTIFELKVAVIDAWRSITNEMRKSLIESMRNRIFELIQQNGELTN